jgi:hypothetical protein
MAGEFVQHAGVAKSWALAKIKEVIEKLSIDEYFKPLHDRFQKAYSKSSSDTKIEYLFHYACRCGGWEELELPFIEAVIEECLKSETQDGGREVLKCLFELENSHGCVPFLAIGIQSARHLKNFLSRMRPDFKSSYSILLNACDRRKWRPIHVLVTRLTDPEILKELVMGKMIDVNARLPSSKATALHLAIFHNRPEAVKIILEADSVDVNAILETNVVYGSKRKNGMKRSSRYWSPLQLAAIMGRADVVRILLTKVCYISTTICGIFFHHNSVQFVY